ncbi:MAG: prolyl oligopeptidase family serine peptidase [Hyphomicrobiaceae bacterium]|nr:prolyl oligopeptidase family serine peptidase [Hyphomicrobiaceae bacterium]
MTRNTRPYGEWASPLSAETVAGKSKRFGALQADGGSLFWSESRPDEGGRGVIVRADAGGRVNDVLPPPFSARSKVHEYGGGEFLAADGRVFFVDADTQDIHELLSGDVPSRLTSEKSTRFADMTLDESRRRLIAVAERHDEGVHEPVNFIAAVPLPGTDSPKGRATLVSGADFYASPRISPDGTRFAWLAWNLPHMPWESAALFVAEIDKDGSPGPAQQIAGGENEAAFQPEWGGDGHLYFISDESGWGRLCAWDGENVREIVAAEAELLRPQWVFGMQSYALLGDSTAVAAFIEEGETKCELIDLGTGEVTPLPGGLRSIDALAPFDDSVALIGASDTAAPAVVSVSHDGGATVLQSSSDDVLSPQDISVGEILKFEGADGVLYALYYPPANSGHSPPPGELPPTIILIHGGPTGMADRGLKLKTQFWTSHGFAVCDLDYSGSAGYGRAYRERLNGLWGVRDIEDVSSLIRHLCEAGRADSNRLLISGGSAGGYTVLMALVKLDAFAAGACSYAVADLAQLQRFTHKFEAGYLYGLTGTTPQTCDPVFAERSPINHAAEISSPVIFFQGLDDLVVPPAQSRKMVQTLRNRGVPVAYKEFEGEGHGFRRAETIIDVLQSEYAFYARILGLEPSERLPELPLDNWNP